MAVHAHLCLDLDARNRELYARLENPDIVAVLDGALAEGASLEDCFAAAFDAIDACEARKAAVSSKPVQPE